MKKSPLQTDSLIADDESLASQPDTKYALSSAFGKIIQKATYSDLIVGAVLAILCGSVLIQVTGSLKPAASYADVLYFCFVTFTTLGYGDFTPVGFARVISVLLTLCGLLFTTLLIGKFASERQQAMLLLLHTSDCQRRIDAFCAELLHLDTELRDAFDARDTPKMQEALKALISRFEASSNYIIFHANQSDLTGFGNDSVLMKFYHVISHVQDNCHTIHTQKLFIPDVLVFNRSLALAKRTCSLISIMYKLHMRSMKNYGYTDALLIGIRNRLAVEDVIGETLVRPVSRYDAVRLFLYKQLGHFTTDKEFDENHSLLMGIGKLRIQMQERLRQIIEAHKTIINPLLLSEVYDLMPTGGKESWGKGIHKTIAVKLKISGNLAQKAIDLLIDQKKLPRYPRKGGGSL
ncbi:potassium channel family protein [Serratia fonticola]|uniref:Potassium channel family protein n=1 Tax=Serratia fonticola TaxID=47917 RepID=A0AAE7JVP0_SERFO|nr:potassium channel family protein [Serratia fonticola]MEB7886234.1 potassium channel family protein [Serratia fonticola]QKJ61138.2 potassium channel family protein [Serratia fonticola]